MARQAGSSTDQAAQTKGTTTERQQTGRISCGTGRFGEPRKCTAEAQIRKLPIVLRYDSARAMATIDPAQEFQRLSDVYSRMADEQLEVVARDSRDLTEIA